MKIKLLTAVVGAALVTGSLATQPAFAAAEAYGHLDIGVQRVDPGGGYEGAKIFVNDQQGSSGGILGFRATEDIGGGLKGLAVIELGMSTDTGELDNAAVGTGTCPTGLPTDPISACASTTVTTSSTFKLFQRQIFVGLTGDFGTLTGGRQYREAFLVGNAAAYNYTAAAIGVFFLNTYTGIRQDNFIKYASPSFGGVSVLAGYAPGEGTTADGTNKDNGKYMEAGVKWSAGPLQFAAVKGKSTADAAATSPVDTDVLTAGGQYSFGPATVYAIYATGENDPKTLDESTVSLGGKYTIGNGDVVLQVGTRKNDAASSADSTLMGVAYYHRLSKTTIVYAAYGNLSNDSGATLNAPRQAVNTTATGEDPSTFSFGIRRFF